MISSESKPVVATILACANSAASTQVSLRVQKRVQDNLIVARNCFETKSACELPVPLRTIQPFESALREPVSATGGHAFERIPYSNDSA